MFKAEETDEMREAKTEERDEMRDRGEERREAKRSKRVRDLDSRTARESESKRVRE